MNIFERIRASEKIRMPIIADSQISALQTITTLQSHVGRWRVLRARVTGKGLLSTMLTVGSLTLLVKVVAAGKEAVVARQLGVGNALDAFIVAFYLPSLAMSVIATSFNSALIPTYIEVRERAGKAAAQQLFSGVMFWSIGLLVAASALLAFLFPLLLPFLASSFSPQKIAFTRLLFWSLLPVITITGAAINWTAVLNAEGEFALPAAVPVVTSLVISSVLLLWVQTLGAWGLTIGTFAGACLEAVLIGSYLSRQGISLLPQWRGMSADMRQVMRQLAPLAAATLVFGGMGLADQTIAARLGPGNVAALNYGSKVVIMIISVSATAVSTSVLPHFSRLVANDDWKSLRGNLKTYSLLLLLTLVPVALLLAYFSVPIVRLGFQRGAFTAQDTRLVSHIQACFALQVPFYTLGMMYLRLLSALKMNNRIFLVSGVGVILNYILDVVLAKHFGIAGIALSTTIVAAIWSGTSFLFLVQAIPRAKAAELPCN